MEATPAPAPDTSAALTSAPDPVASYFSIVNPDEKQASKLEAISTYLRGDKKEYDQIDMIRDLKNVLFKLGTPPVGETLFDMVWQYAKINSQISQLEAEKSRFER